MDAYKTIIAESDPMLRKLYEDYIRDTHNFISIKSVTTGKEMFDVLMYVNVDVVILDIYLKDFDKLSGLKKLRRLYPATGCIIVSSDEDTELVNQALSLGAFNFIPKPFEPEKLQDTLYSFRIMKNSAIGINTKWTQNDITSFITTENVKRVVNNTELIPRGISADTVNAVEALLWSRGTAISAKDAAIALGKSRSAARRYLEFLIEANRVVAEKVFNRLGRPQKQYRLKMK